MNKKQKRRLNPVMSTGAEYLVMGHLMRKNIQTFKAPEGNEGYDLLCVNPSIVGMKCENLARVQVKSRAAWDCDGGFKVKCFDDGRIDASGFDFLITVFLNVLAHGDGKYRGFAQQGLYNLKNAIPQPIEFFVFSAEELEQHPEWISGRRLRLSHKVFETSYVKFMGDAGLEKIGKWLQNHNAKKRIRKL